MINVKEFCKIIAQNRLDELADRISGKTGRTLGPNERQSYQQTSIALKKAMSINPSLGNVHMLFEYKLPSAYAWCDIILLGKNDAGRPQLLIIELKNWRKNTLDQPGPKEGLMWHNNDYMNHPANQVWGYVEYCRRFHSTVQEENAECNGLVFFTQPIDTKPYCTQPNDALVSRCPLFNTLTIDDLARHIADRMHQADLDFADKFFNGYYKQDRNILRQVAETISNHGKDVESPFQLLDAQQEGYAAVMAALEQRQADGLKRVIVVEGPPGSGKSAVAINVWAEAALKYTMNQMGNCVFVTTSQSQNDNWISIFKEYGGNVAKNLIIKGTSYGPGLNSTTQPDIVQHIDAHGDPCQLLTPAHNTTGYTIRREKYAEIVDYMVRHNLQSHGYSDNQYLLSVVDEAHALVNPLSPDYMGVNQGWATFRGPQAYHIIKQSQVSVFFTDNEQSFRDFESTSTDDIKKFAAELHAQFIHVPLKGMQFRCSGSVDYTEWVDHLFEDQPLKNYMIWKKQYSVKMFDYPSELETYLRTKFNAGDKSVRLLSSYTKKWVSKNKVKALHRSSAPYDFIIPDKDGKDFCKYWNSKYDAFVQAVDYTSMNTDPLSEVGCPYVVRGFDYSWIGLIWLKDFIYRKQMGGWCISSKYVEETGISAIKSQAMRAFQQLPEADQQKYVFEGEPLFSRTMTDRAIQRLFKALSQAYRILLTRALKGLGIYIQDEETRDYINSLLK